TLPGGPATPRHRSRFRPSSTTCTEAIPHRPAAGRHETGNPLRQNALDPGFHGVLTGPAHPSREVDGADGTGAAFRSRTTPNRGQAGDRDVVLVVLMGLGCVPCSRDAGRAIAQGALAGRPRGGNTSGDNLVVM